MIELLEARIAPAALNGNVLTYKDVDGDFVRVVFTHATMAAGDFAFSTGTVDGTTTTAQALSSITLTGKTGAGFTLTATQLAGQGDSHANIGTITSTSTALGAIVIDGDLANANFTAPSDTVASLKSLTVLSLGKSSTNGNDAINITGINVLNVRTDVANVEVSLNHSSIMTAFVNVGGSLIGGAVADSAFLAVSGSVRTVHIGGDLHGGSGITSGSLDVSGPGLLALTIGGSVFGGTNNDSGVVLLSSSSSTTVSIGGDVRGGSHEDSGFLSTQGAALLRIGGSVIGSGFSETGSIFASDNVGALIVGHNVQGGDNASSSSVSQSGEVSVFGNLGTLVVAGELITGQKIGAAALTEDGLIGVSGVLTRAVLGGIEGNADVAAYLTVGGTGATTGAKLAIGSLTVLRSVTYGSILTGYDSTFAQKNLASGIGTVVIGGNLSASFITTGAAAGSDGIPGTSDDFNTSSSAVLQSLRIGGTFSGVAGSNTEYYVYSGIIERVTIGRAVYTHAALSAPVLLDSIGQAYLASRF